jgi:tRNA threonylcarbamoyladenosine biosynthesis protein TsaE
MTTKITTKTAAETEKLGHSIGALLHGGEVIELVSDLGGGKTTFTRGLVAGTGSKDLVSSPTFTISNTYDAPSFAINHFDFYRLQEAGLMEYELEDVLGQADQVVIVEWSDVVAHVLPKDRLTIRIASSGEDKRAFTLEYPKSLEYMVQGL